MQSKVTTVKFVIHKYERCDENIRFRRRMVRDKFTFEKIIYCIIYICGIKDQYQNSSEFNSNYCKISYSYV